MFRKLLMIAVALLWCSLDVASAAAPGAQQGPRLVGTGAVGAALQGFAVAISADGNTAILGGIHERAGVGAVWVFTRTAGVWSQQGTKLIGTGAVGSSYQGSSVALSADGNTAIVGGPGDNSSVGAAWVFTRTAGVWSQQGAKLAGSDAMSSAQQGNSVSLSADGNTAIVGGYTDNDGPGAAWVYTRSGTVWSQQGSKLIGTGAIGTAGQGASVSVSGDGNTALVGGPYDNTSVGAAWVFTRSAGVWSQQGAKLVGSGAVDVSGQGISVSLSGDGNTAIVGGNLDNAYAGAAWVYTRTGGVWSQQGAKLVGTGAVNALQGGSVSLSSDGNTALVGGRYDNGSTGAAWVYTRSLGVWSQQGAKLVGSGAVGTAQQGCGVAVSGDGNTAFMGGPYDSGEDGAAWAFIRVAGVWSQQGTKRVGNDAQGAPYQGYAVAVSADGNTAIVGGYSDHAGIGAAWVFTRSVGVWSQQGAKLIGSGAVGAANQGVAVAVSADGNTAIVGGYADDSNTGAAWVYTRSGGVWSQQGPKLVGTGALGSAYQGRSVALSSDGNTAIIGGPYDDGIEGAAWVFTRSAGVWSQQGGKLVGTAASGANQGISISLSADGNTAIVGGYTDGPDDGAAWVFTRSAGVWSQQGPKLFGTGAVTAANQGISVAVSGDGNTAMVGGYGDDSGIGAAWVYTRTAGVWTQQGAKLVGTGSLGHPYQGVGVSLSTDGNTAVMGGYGDNTGVGATWVYTRSAGVWTQHGSKLVGTGAVGSADQGGSVALSGDGRTAIVGGAYDNGGVGAVWVFVDPALLDVMPPGVASSELRLAPPFPNPATGRISITFSAPRDLVVSLGVYDIEGRSVKTLIAGPTAAGDHTIRWDGRTSAGRSAPGGIYFLALRAGGDELTRRFVLLR